MAAPMQGYFPRDPKKGATLLNLVIDVKRDYGASGSSESTTGSIDSGSTTLALAAIEDFKNGQGISVAGAGTSGALLVTSIVSGGGTTTLALKDAAGTTVSGADVYHDDTSAIQSALDQNTPTSGEIARPVYIPEGTYFISSPLVIPPFTIVYGDGIKATSIWTNQPINMLNCSTEAVNRNAHIVVQGMYLRNNSTVASTTLAAAASSGDTSVTVASATGIVAGYQLIISAGTDVQELATVASTYTSGSTTVPLAAALADAHSSGDYVCSPANITLNHPIIGSFIENVRTEYGTIGILVIEGDTAIYDFVAGIMSLWGIEIYRGGTELISNIYSESNSVAGILIHDTAQACSITMESLHLEESPTGLWLKSASQVVATGVYGTAPSYGGGVALVHVGSGCANYTLWNVISIFNPRFLHTIQDDTLSVTFPDYDQYLFFRLWSDQEGLANTGTAITAGTLQGFVEPRFIAGVKSLSGAGPGWTAGQGQNLRGIAEAVAASSASYTATFPNGEPDTSYAVAVTTSWETTVSVSKATTGITFTFGTAPSSAGTLDWIIIR